MNKARIFLGFDFYGAGNIGDDLMLQGFLRVVQRRYKNYVPFTFGCISPHAIGSSQRYRFPLIEWSSDKETCRRDVLSSYNYWLGVGDTPFQITSGSWILDHILKDVVIAKEKSIPMYMLGVGAEQEATESTDSAHKVTDIVRQCKRIWARDEFSVNILKTSSGCSGDSIIKGADLAHLALQELFPVPHGEKKVYDLAIGYYSEHIESEELDEIKLFLLEKAKKQNVVFFANEVRQEFEYSVYAHMFSSWKNVFKRPAVQFFRPSYETGSVYDLVLHFNRYKTVVSSRYHALVIAAWAGCKVVALDRSSKIRELSKELQIPIIRTPFTYTSLCEGVARAVEVPRGLLNSLKESAEQSVIELLDEFNTFS